MNGAGVGGGGMPLRPRPAHESWWFESATKKMKNKIIEKIEEAATSKHSCVVHAHCVPFEHTNKTSKLLLLCVVELFQSDWNMLISWSPQQKVQSRSCMCCTALTPPSDIRVRHYIYSTGHTRVSASAHRDRLEWQQPVFRCD